MSKFIVVNGTLLNGKLSWPEGHETDALPAPAPDLRVPFLVDADLAVLEAEWRGEGDRVVWRGPVPLVSTCGGPGLVFAWVIPSPDAVGGRLLRLSLRGRVLAERKVADQVPDLRPRVTVSKKGMTVQWKGEAATVDVLYRRAPGAPWRALTAGGAPGGRVFVPAGELPGGERCEVEIVATSGLRTGRSRSAPFVLPELGCRPVVISPAEGTILAQPEGVDLVGQGVWMEEGTAELEALVWRSDRDGELGRGAVLHAGLSVGAHVITLRAGGPKGQVAEVKIEVVAPSSAWEPALRMQAERRKELGIPG